jgi:poly-D-alanine transfer protein DltD
MYWSIFYTICLLFVGGWIVNPFINAHHTRTGLVLRCLESNLQQASDEHEFVLFFGSSRFQSAIDIQTFAQISRNEKLAFLNLAQPNMGPWHYSVVLKNVGTSLSRIRLIVFEISPWMFNKNALTPRTTERFLHRDEVDSWGTWQERLEIREMDQRLEAMTVGMVSRHPLSAWITAFQSLDPVYELDAPEYRIDASAEEKLRSDPYFRAEYLSKYHLHEFEFDQGQKNTLEKLLEQLDSVGIAVLLVHPPVKSEYYDYLDTDHRYRAEFLKYESALEKLPSDLAYWETPFDCGLDDAIFLDYGHLSRGGSADFARRLYAEMKGIVE